METPEITPFTEYRRYLRDHFQRMRDSDRVLIVTTNGRPDAVVMTPERYEQLSEAEEMLRSLRTIDKGVEETRAGQTRPMKEGLREVANDLGVNLER